MGLRLNPDGSIRNFTESEIDAMRIRNFGVRDGSHPTHTRSMNSSTITRAYKVDGNPDRIDDAIAYFLGGAVMTQGQSLSRLMPQTYPGKSSFAAVAIESITGAGGPGIDNDDDVPEYPDARMVVRYEHVPFVLQSDANTTAETQRYVQTIPSRSDVSYLTLPGGTLNYITSDNSRPDETPIPFTVGFPETQATRSFKWWRVPFLAWQPNTPLFERVYGDLEENKKPWIGTVNSQSLYGIPAGQLLFLGVEEDLVTDPLGESLCWHLTMIFLHKPRNHNWLYFNDVATTTTNKSGYYFAGRKNAAGVFQYYDTADLPDGVALFNARDHRKLFDVGP